MTIRVLIADDQAMVREGLRLILDLQPDLEVVAEAGDGQAALRAVAEHRPDVVLMDIRMPVMDGLQATERLLRGGRPGPRVLILTTFGEDEYLYAAMRAGASGFLLKDSPRSALLHAVRTVAEQQLAGLEQRCSTAVADAQAAAEEGQQVDRAQVLAVALSAEGYAASASAISGGGQLCQLHCPVAHVAAEFPQLCEAETAVIGRLVGTHVQRLATIAHGDGICTTHIPGRLTLRGGNKATPARPVPAGRAVHSTPSRGGTPSSLSRGQAGASTAATPSIDRERTPA